jgi:muramoyltetrapeptide carboxypeptidase
MALASRLDYESLQPAFRLMRDTWGLEVVEGQTLHASHHYFAAADDLRRQEFQQYLDDPSIRAVFSARGGYGSSRILDQLNFRKFRQQPKWVVGFSDITAVLSQLYNVGFESLHAAMPKQFGNEGAAESVETLRKVLFGERLDYHSIAHPLNRMGQAEGRVAGGNLCLLAHLIGSKAEVDTRNSILFIEDVGEYYYNLDRMLLQLKRAGKLKRLAGLIVGQFNDLKQEATPFGQSAYEIVQAHVQEYNYPVSYDFPVGHTADNWAIPVGRKAALHVEPTKVRLTFSV